MYFNSLQFILFFFTLLIIYYLIPGKFKSVLLLVTSVFFYACWNPLHVFLMLAVILITYFAARYIENHSGQSRRLMLSLGIIGTLAFLLIFKYSGLIMNSLYAVLDRFGISYVKTAYSFELPMGISFYTFKSVGYLMDVYRGKIAAEKRILHYATYVSFFPQLMSGPIERSTHFLPQLDLPHRFDAVSLRNGLRMMLVGYAQKMVIADNLSGIVTKVFAAPESYSSLALLLTAVLFSFQIYCDFAGCSSIAVGCAKAFGYDTVLNFDSPYFSKSIKEFWRRWHISLSTWFRDYLYIPLGGNRKGTFRKYGNLMIVFLVSGLWHGASYSFIFWGFLHGFYQIFGDLTRNRRKRLLAVTRLDKCPRLLSVLQTVLTFSLVTFAWIFFKAGTIQEGFQYIGAMVSHFDTNLSLSGLIALLKNVFGTQTAMFSAAMGLIPFIILSLIHHRKNLFEVLDRRSSVEKILVYSILVAYIILFSSTTVSDFIYARF